MATVRAYSGETRLATAVELKSGKILQVYPRKPSLGKSQEFGSLEEWKAAIPEADNFILTQCEIKPKKKSSTKKRQEKEIAEFFHADYAWMFNDIKSEDIKGKQTIVATVHKEQGIFEKWTVYRSINFFEPPVVTRDGKRVTQFDTCYSPALTSIRWLMMLLNESSACSL